MSDATNPAEAIFVQALEIPPDEQSAFLRERCAGDNELFQCVSELLAAHAKTDTFIIDRVQAIGAGIDVNATNWIGKRLGAYTIRERIGEGGMGVVYVAEQASPIRRKVALKVIKPGMDTKAVLARFEAEQQALALMSHRSIARVFDAGMADSGHPYFVMELVPGIPITEYCDQKQLSITERLELFIQVCRAIQHAHQKGIIHRDIKPSNVLVTEEDGQAVPKVIDFGVAKALSHKLTDRTVYTNFRVFLGTPLYASPEQASLSNVDVDTRSDVYSLGVLLYELVTGSTPHSKQALQNAAYDEMCRIIQNQEAMKPSTRLSTLGDSVTEVSQLRRSDPNRLRQLVRGDLDCIVMKAIEKDRVRRYEGPSNLAADIGRLLRNEAIVARSPSTLYRLSRLYARNRVAVIAASAVVVFLTIGLGIVTFAVRERYRLLAKYNEQAVTMAFQQAISGSDTAFDSSFRIAEAAGVSDDWLDTLAGVKAFHDGDNNTALELFDTALELNEHNTAAWALKAVALVDQGELHKWRIHVRDFEKYQLRPGYEAIDKLCMAYATYHVNLDQAIVQFEEVLEDHPTWNMARALYAAALAEKGEISNQPALIKKALAESSVANHITPESGIVQVIYILTRSIAVREKIYDVEFYLDEAEPVVARLAKKSDYDLGKLLVADFYSLANAHAPSEDAKQREIVAWKSALDAVGNLASRAYAELFRLHCENMVLKASPSDPEARIARACVLAHDPNTIDEATRLFKEYEDQFDTWYMRSRLIQLPLLLKDGEKARDLCSHWSKSDRSRDLKPDEAWYRQLAIHIAQGTLSSLAPENTWQEVVKEYFLALVSYADDDMPQAKKHLDYCVQHRSVNSADHWSRAFRARWQF